ncbi:hypothetical protein MJD09_10655 [bacterium]|nr:hypothetical protein [bacterium]
MRTHTYLFIGWKGFDGLAHPDVLNRDDQPEIDRMKAYAAKTGTQVLARIEHGGKARICHVITKCGLAFAIINNRVVYQDGYELD